MQIKISEITLRTYQNGYNKKNIKNENDMSWQDVEKLELSYMRGGT